MVGVKKSSLNPKQRWLTLKEKNEVLQLSGEKVIKIIYFLCSKVLPKFTMMVQQVSQRAIASRFGVSQAAASIITKKKACVFELPQISYLDLVQRRPQKGRGSGGRRSEFSETLPLGRPKYSTR